MTTDADTADGIDWIQVNFDPNDFNTFEDYIEAIRDEFQNENFIDFIEPTLEELFLQAQ